MLSSSGTCFDALGSCSSSCEHRQRPFSDKSRRKTDFRSQSSFPSIPRSQRYIRTADIPLLLKLRHDHTTDLIVRFRTAFPSDAFDFRLRPMLENGSGREVEEFGYAE